MATTERRREHAAPHDGSEDQKPGLAGWHDWRPVGVAALLALLLGGGLIAIFGQVSEYDRPTVLTGLMNSIFWLAASMIGACGTIAALMLTTVGLMEHLETERLTPRFLVHLRLIVRAAILTIGLAVIALLLTIFPASGTEQVTPAEWEVDLVYWATLITTALMLGGFTTVLGSLFVTINEILETLPRSWVKEIMTEEEEHDRAAVDEERRPAR